jgi:hypothetical protein
MRRALLTINLFIITVALAGQVYAAALFVSPTGSGTACSQAAPCNLSESLSQSVDGDNLYLAGGVYTGSGGAVATITSSVVIRGGWDGTTTTPPVVNPFLNPSTINGQGSRRGVNLASAKVAVLMDLIITNGLHASMGGGIYANNAMLILRRVQITSCAAYNTSSINTFGGGVYLNTGTLLVRDTIFNGNSAACGFCSSAAGGAILVEDADHVEITGSRFTKNDAMSGGAVSVWALDTAGVTVRDCVFQENGTLGSVHPEPQGGGALSLYNVEAKITDSLFTGNYKFNSGAAVWAKDTILNAYRNIFTSNNSSHYSAGLKVWFGSVDLVNNLFTNNWSDDPTDPVSAIDLGNSTGTIKHTTVVGRSGSPRGTGIEIGGLGSSVTMENTILARLETGIDVGFPSTVDADGILWGDDGWANGNDYHVDSGATLNLTMEVTADPGFRDGTNDDFHLIKGSAGRDSGCASGVRKDLDRTPRDSSPDIGAYEYTGKVSVGFPAKKEAVPAGSLYRVRWAAPARAKNFTVKYSLNDGMTWKMIQKKVTAKVVDWQVPKAWKNRKKCLIKVTAFDKTGAKMGSAISKRFTILVVSLPMPGKGQEIQAGDRAVIYWETNTAKRRVNKVILKYTKDGSSTWTKIVPEPGPFDPSIHFWQVPNLKLPRDQCKIKLILKSQSGKNLGRTTTEGWFSIAAP